MSHSSTFTHWNVNAVVSFLDIVKNTKIIPDSTKFCLYMLPKKFVLCFAFNDKLIHNQHIRNQTYTTQEEWKRNPRFHNKPLRASISGEKLVCCLFIKKQGSLKA